MHKILIAFCLSIALISCFKEQSASAGASNAATLNLLQNKWIIDSLYIYPSTGLSSNYIYAFKPSDVQYEDFGSDGKVYSYGGSPTAFYDTAAYKLLPGNKTFLVYTINSGVTSSVADTGYILTLTTSSFVYYSLNAAREYGKWVLKR